MNPLFIVYYFQEFLDSFYKYYKESHQTLDLSTEPVHSVFAFDLAAPLSCMYSASSKPVHRSWQSSPRFILDKSEPIPYKPRASGAYQHQMARPFPETGFSQNSSHPDRSEEYRVDHSPTICTINFRSLGRLSGSVNMIWYHVPSCILPPENGTEGLGPSSAAPHIRVSVTIASLQIVRILGYSAAQSAQAYP